MSKDRIVLPRQDVDGNYLVSYSQISLWGELKGFDTGKLGRHEYIRKYFLGETFIDNKGFGVFGQQCENYVCLRQDGEHFNTQEKEVLESITPLGVFQKEVLIPFEGFKLRCILDDCTENMMHIRDYKTASQSSAKKYYTEDYDQLKIYALAVKYLTGKLPEKLEYTIIERTGNGFKGGRNVMSVGTNVWYVEKPVNQQLIDEIKDKIINTVAEISTYYKIFTLLNTSN